MQKKDSISFFKGLKYNNKWFWIKSLFLIALFLYFMSIGIINPQNWLKYTRTWYFWLPLTSYVIFYEGRTYFILYRNLFRRVVDMNTLVGLAAHILYIYSVFQTIININSLHPYIVLWEDAAILILVINIGHHLESSIQKSATDAYKELDKIRTSDVTIIENNVQSVIKVDEVKKGQIILINKGSIIPLDGFLLNDEATFDYSNITGESKKIYLKKGDLITSGSFNTSDLIKIKVEKEAYESTIALIVDKIEELSASKPKLQKLADKILKYFVPVVLMISFLTFCLWLILGYGFNFTPPWMDILMSQHSSKLNMAITAAVTVLAISCPCALGIATPLIYTISSIVAIKSGILINNIPALENIKNIKYFAFDKTGTITSDELKVTKIIGDKKYLPIAITLEQNIEHPLALSIRNIDPLIKKVKISKIESKDGVGIFGVWNNKNVSIKRSTEIDKHNTYVSLYIEDKEVLIFHIQNEIKEGVKRTILELKKHNIIPVMITGDNELIANEVANEVGIEKVYANALPIDKVNIISELQKTGKVVFVGDGFNDSISMKKADISIAFISGSDITNALSDISILNNNFYSIYKILSLSTLNNRGVKLSLTWAFMFNIIAIPLSVMLIILPWMGALLMSISNVFVSANAYFYKKIGFKKIVKKK